MPPFSKEEIFAVTFGIVTAFTSVVSIFIALHSRALVSQNPSASDADIDLERQQPLNGTHGLNISQAFDPSHVAMDTSASTLATDSTHPTIEADPVSMGPANNFIEDDTPGSVVPDGSTNKPGFAPQLDDTTNAFADETDPNGMLASVPKTNTVRTR